MVGVRCMEKRKQFKCNTQIQAVDTEKSVHRVGSSSITANTNTDLRFNSFENFKKKEKNLNFKTFSSSFVDLQDASLQVHYRKLGRSIEFPY